ncbi:MAG: hypothetical protein M3P42_02770 [Actinomycetota bacterium]|nr:hypothetical protein [Actinomycetota bacterium]
MRLAIYAIATFGAGIGFTAIAHGVLPTLAAMSRARLVALGLGAGAIGALAMFGDVRFGPIVAAAAAFLVVFLDDRRTRR